MFAGLPSFLNQKENHLYKLITINRELTNKDLELNQPILVNGCYTNTLIILPISFLESFKREVVLGYHPLNKNWSWSLEDGDVRFGNLKNAHKYRGRWVLLTKELTTEIEEAIKIANKKSIKLIDKEGPMYCKKCDIRWNWDENAPNAAYNDLSCPNCNKTSKEV
jgi:hypothetical protein